MILDLLEIWLAVVVAFVAGAFVGALLHDRLARSRLSVGQAAFAEVVAMGVGGARAALAGRRARTLEEEDRARGRQPSPDRVLVGAPVGELDRVRGIDPAEVARLAGAGYGRLDQVARWSDAEQAWIADQMVVSRRRVGRWTARAQTILRREQAAREALPRPVRARKSRPKKEAGAGIAVQVSQPAASELPKALERIRLTEPAHVGHAISPVRRSEPKPVERALPRVAEPDEVAPASRPDQQADPSPPAGKAPASGKLTPYEIALDLELRKP